MHHPLAPLPAALVASPTSLRNNAGLNSPGADAPSPARRPPLSPTGGSSRPPSMRGIDQTPVLGSPLGRRNHLPDVDENMVVPAALAALLHQSDRSGKQNATPLSTHVGLNALGIASVPRSSAQPAALTPQARAEAPPAAVVAPAVAVATPASPPAQPSFFASLFCCFSGPQPQQPLTSRQRNSPTASVSSASAGASSSSVEEGSAGPPPPLRSPSGFGSPAGGSSGPDTPSRVLSPTSRNATRSKAAARAAAASKAYDRSTTKPWGSNHPAVTAAEQEALSQKKRSAGWSVYGFRSSTGSSPPAAPEAEAAPSTPLSRRTIDTQSLGVVRSPRPVQLPPGGLNASGHPVVRFNNVRRPHNGIGEGPLLAQLLDMDRGRHCLVVRGRSCWGWKDMRVDFTLTLPPSPLHSHPHPPRPSRLHSHPPPLSTSLSPSPPLHFTLTLPPSPLPSLTWMRRSCTRHSSPCRTRTTSCPSRSRARCTASTCTSAPGVTSSWSAWASATRSSSLRHRCRR